MMIRLPSYGLIESVIGCKDGWGLDMPKEPNQFI
ncbi:hypothetical protein J2S09_000096 [Bacillus fengqiuensis]|nr:hypothetical protein [Bacillus fengqiuensis]